MNKCRKRAISKAKHEMYKWTESKCRDELFTKYYDKYKDMKDSDSMTLFELIDAILPSDWTNPMCELVKVRES